MPAEVGNVEDALAGLYRLPLADFVPARDQLARQLRAAGDRESARQVAALRRPSISVWAANQLAQAAPNAMADLLDAGAALRAAQQDALVGQPGAARRLRATGAQLRAAISRLIGRAETLLHRAGYAASDATLARLAATLQAAATAEETTRAALAEGRLAGDLDPAGFGLPFTDTPAPVAAAEPAAAPAPSVPAVDAVDTRREQARQAAQRALERTGRAAEQARAALEHAQAAAADQEQAAVAARRHAEDLAAQARELAEKAAAAATAADQAHQQAEAAERDAQALADRVRLAHETADAAEAAHAAASDALQELQGP